MNKYFKFFFLSVALTLAACSTEKKNNNSGSSDSDSSMDTATANFKDTTTDSLDSSGIIVDTSLDSSDTSTESSDTYTDTVDGSYTKDEMSQIACDMLKECNDAEYILSGGDEGCSVTFKTNYFTNTCDIYHADKAFMCAETINTCDKLMAELNQTAVNVQCDAMCEDFSDSDSIDDTGSDTTVITLEGSVSLYDSAQTGGTGHVCVGLFTGGCPDMLSPTIPEPIAGGEYSNVALDDTSDVQQYSIDLSENMSPGTYGLGALFLLTDGVDCTSMPQSGDYYGCNEFNVTVDNSPPQDIPISLESTF
ncbi:MAG: hypothetical protein JXR91_00455 [Deltaproteobacteria bacterium]|nr:hypothetical protein [Deltaproteobacteria bacterium]